jgi:phosphatidate cytidylyltransferase
LVFSHPSQLVLIGFFLGLSLFTLFRNRIRLPTPARVYLPYLWLFFLAFTLADLVEVKLWIWVLAALSFLALREYFTLVDLRVQDRWGILVAYLTIPFMYYFLSSEWYGMFIISIPVWAFLAVPFAVALGRESEGAVFSVGVIDLGVFLLVYCIGHIGYLASYSTWMAVYLVSGVVICDLLAVLLKSREKPPLRATLLQILIPGPLVAALGFALVPWSGIPVAHSLILGFMIPALVAMGAFTMDCLETDMGIDRNRLKAGRGAVLNSMKSFLYTAPVVFHYLRYYLEAF